MGVEKIPPPKLSLKPIDLSAPPGIKRLMSAGQLGGALYPTEDPSQRSKRDAKRQDSMNLSFGKAMESWNTHRWPEAIKEFKKHVADFPDSPWASESRLHMACEARYQGRYSEAGSLYQTILQNNNGKEPYGAKRLANKARLRLGVLESLKGNHKKSSQYFRELKANSDDWRERTYASYWILQHSRNKKQQLALVNCGYQALAEMLKRQGKAKEANEVLQRKATSEDGQSVSELKSLAGVYGYSLLGRRIQPSDLNDLVLPVIVQLDRKSPGAKGHYWILEQKEANRLRLYDPQSGRRYDQTVDEFIKEWDGVILAFAMDDASLIGKPLTQQEMDSLSGACCGLPAPPGNLGDPSQTNDTDRPTDNNDLNNDLCNEPNQCSLGEPQWEVNMVNFNFRMEDTPIWYIPPIGPTVSIRLSYNSQSAFAFNEPFGNKWQFNYGGYLVDDPGGVVTIFMPDGRRDVYNTDGVGGYIGPEYTHSSLTKIADNHFELTFNTGSVFVYKIPTGTTSQQPFLVEIRDVYGQALQFGYDVDVRMTTITDAQSKVTRLTYNGNDRVTEVADPFGRKALFEYDTNGNLIKITDMGGYWTSFTYDQDIYLTSLTNATGTWAFYFEPPGINTANFDYPAPGEPMWENQRITITDPLGNKEEYFYDGYHANGWYVSPRDYVEYSSSTNNNSHVPKIVYSYSVTENSGRGIIESKEYPDNTFESYSYDSIGRRTAITDALSNTRSFTYNDDGSVASETFPSGHIINKTWTHNGTVPLKVWDNRGEIVYTSNNQRKITNIKDRLFNETNFSYNTFGQLLTLTDSLGVVSEFIYGTDHRLLSVKRDGQVTTSFVYDAYGRVSATTGSDGVQHTFIYDDLDQIKEIGYPDAKKLIYGLSTVRPFLTDSITDRGGHTTQYQHDSLKRTTAQLNPERGSIKNSYDPNGNLISFSDPNSNVTSYEYDLNNHVTRKVYADGSAIQYDYNQAGQLASRIDARGITASYGYDVNGNLTSISYDDGTPSVTYSYDAYDRVSQRVDGTGTYNYAYNNNSQLTSLNGPWSGDTISYQYDELGRLINLAVGGGQSVDYAYDSLGRLSTVAVGAATYQYGYNGVDPKPATLTRPSGAVTHSTYDNVGRLTQLSNETDASAIINRYDYTYNAQDFRGSESVTNGLSIAALSESVTTNTHNNLNQVVTSAGPQQKQYIYDASGNLTQGYTIDGYMFTAIYDAADRLSSLEFTDGSGVSRRTEYQYGADGFVRVARKLADGALVSEKRFVRDGILVLQERNGSNAVNREYTWDHSAPGGIGGLLSLQQNSQSFDYLYNGIGNVTALIDGTQSVVASYSYDPFGNNKNENASISQPMQYSTKYFDEEIGLIDFGYRRYIPHLGKWISRDPIAEYGGINLYGYAGSNPINYVDPTGERFVAAIVVAVVIHAVISQFTSCSKPGGKKPKPKESARETACVAATANMPLPTGSYVLCPEKETLSEIHEAGPHLADRHLRTKGSPVCDGSEETKDLCEALSRPQQKTPARKLVEFFSQ